MSDDVLLHEIFFDVQRGLPRQGPGSDASTRKTLTLCRGLPARPAILDIGCGPGMQTVALASATGGTITAVDTSREYLDELKARADAADVASRIAIVAADMNRLPFAPESFDLIWSEGAAYIMGFDNALAAWRRFLRPGGFLAVSELVWLVPDPPAEAAAFFAEGYPAMTGTAAVLARLYASGYTPVGHFTLPDRDWWESYYTPMQAKLPALFARYRGNDAALDVVRMAEREIDIRRRFADAYGYVFFVGRKSDADVRGTRANQA
ncbi:MAG: class I SAM-dependent methyltransferase [Xanthobacteraceae bacterium]|nr:class I SAM-dependent methyltransferase [Xanthobacteraceae bacterium]